MGKTEIQILQDRVNELTSKSLTNTKPLFISDVTQRTGLNGFAIKATVDTVIASISYRSNSSSNTLAGETIAKGDIWFLPNITDIQLTSGSLFIYEH